MHVPAAAGEKYRRLARGVPAPDDNHLPTRATPRFGRGRSIIDPQTEKAPQVLQGRLAILRSRGDDDGTSAYELSMSEFDGVRSPVTPQGQCGIGSSDFRAEFLRLDEGSRCEREARNAGRKSQIILDLGA